MNFLLRRQFIYPMFYILYLSKGKNGTQKQISVKLSIMFDSLKSFLNGSLFNTKIKLTCGDTWGLAGTWHRQSFRPSWRQYSNTVDSSMAWWLIAIMMTSSQQIMTKPNWKVKPFCFYRNFYLVGFKLTAKNPSSNLKRRQSSQDSFQDNKKLVYQTKLLRNSKKWQTNGRMIRSIYIS